MKKILLFVLSIFALQVSGKDSYFSSEYLVATTPGVGSTTDPAADKPTAVITKPKTYTIAGENANIYFSIMSDGEHFQLSIEYAGKKDMADIYNKTLSDDDSIVFYTAFDKIVKACKSDVKTDEKDYKDTRRTVLRDMEAFCNGPHGNAFHLPEQAVQWYGRIYGDFTNIESKGVNGFSQVYFYASVPLLFRGERTVQGFSNRFAVLRNVVPEIEYGKIGSNDLALPVNYFSTRKNASSPLLQDSVKRWVNAYDVLQYKRFRADLKLNLLTVFLNSNTKLYIDGILGFYSTKLDDTLFKAKNLVGVGFMGWAAKLRTSYPPSKSKINMELGGERVKQKLLDNDYYSINGPQYRNKPVGYTPGLNASVQPNKESSKLTNLYLILNYSTKQDEKKDYSTQNVTLRVNFWSNAFDKQEFYNSFWQVQIGYDIQLDELFPSKKDDDKDKEKAKP